MEDFLLKSNFIGRDGFVWWIGEISSEQSWGDNANAGWGNRYKVRIMGYHPYSTAQLKDEDLPWALVMLPPGVGTGGAMISSPVKFVQGDVVVGFFLDGDDGQVPVIMGSFGRTKYYGAESGEKIPFVGASGYSKSFKKVSDYVIKNSETNEPGSAPGPKNVSPKDAARDPERNGNKASTTSTAGYVISLACGNGADDKANSGGKKKKSKATKHNFRKPK